MALTQQLREVPPPVRDLGQVLLDLKLSPPRARSGTVSRAHLIETARSGNCTVVGVTAPAGYGKTTLLSEWADGEKRPVAWVALDHFDDDPAALLVVLASAYTRIDPCRPDLAAEIGSLASSALGRAAPRLAAAFAASPSPFVLILDDLHELVSPACHDVLGLIVTRIPSGSQLVTASRSEQPHMPRLRALGQAMEFLAADLALDATGARQIFSTEQVSLSAEQAVAVAERTEGWPAGIYLAAVIAREGNGNSATVTGDDPYVADYLYRESLSRQPDQTQRFLRQTAVLDQFSGPLCDAILGSSGSAHQLRQLEASSLFLVALDRRREWYRYHALFREFLLGELHRSEPEIIETLHLRAADWFEANGSLPLAVEHLLQTNERERKVRLLAQLNLSNYEAGRQSTNRRWRAMLGDDGIRSYPPLAILAATHAVLMGEPAPAERWAAVVEAASFEGVVPGSAASFEASRAALRVLMCANGPDAMLADAALAASHGEVYFGGRDEVLVLLAEAQLLAGDVERALATFVEASDTAAGLGLGSTVAVAEAELALVAMDRNRWDEAAERLDKSLTTIVDRRMEEYLASSLAYVGAARLALHRGDPEQTRRNLARAMRARPLATYLIPWLAVRLRVQLAKVHLGLADFTAARHMLKEIDDILVRRPALGALLDEVETFRRALSSAPTAASGPTPLTAAELRLLPYLQTHLTLGAIAERLFVSRNTVSSQVTAVYRKLDVSSRREAVEKATAIGLLGG
jgi:LuxR family transcriptional regulator, maltose regulon positive regulatory protein